MGPAARRIARTGAEQLPGAKRTMKNSELLRRVEDLIHKVMALSETALQGENKIFQDQTACATGCLIALADAIMQNKQIFGIEPWHPIQEDVPLARPGEMLLPGDHGVLRKRAGSGD